jgi:hypothetical protein
MNIIGTIKSVGTIYTGSHKGVEHTLGNRITAEVALLHEKGKE